MHPRVSGRCRRLHIFCRKPYLFVRFSTYWYNVFFKKKKLIVNILYLIKKQAYRNMQGFTLYFLALLVKEWSICSRNLYLNQLCYIHPSEVALSVDITFWLDLFIISVSSLSNHKYRYSHQLQSLVEREIETMFVWRNKCWEPVRMSIIFLYLYLYLNRRQSCPFATD